MPFGIAIKPSDRVIVGIIVRMSMIKGERRSRFGSDGYRAADALVVCQQDGGAAAATRQLAGQST